jgi:exo-beta-N-acetylmuramidase NamZ-like protein
LAAALLHLYPKQFEVARMKSLLANDAELARVQRGDDPKRIVAGWQRPLNEFRKKRGQYLLYPELR